MIKYSKLLFCLLSALLLFGCIKNKDYVLNEGLHPDSIIRIAAVTPGYITADSHTAVIIRVVIAAAASENYAITLQTDRGYFSNDSQVQTQTVNMDRYTDFILLPGSHSGPAKLTATVKDHYKAETLLHFHTAYPDTLIIAPAYYVMDNMTDQTIKIKLLKAVGYASAAPVLRYAALDSMGQPAGTLEETTPYVPGADIQLKFTPATGFSGTATLQAILLKGDTATITGHTSVQIR